MIKKAAYLLSLLTILVVSGCAKASLDGPPVASMNEVAELARGFSALGDEVDPEEAARAARIAFDYSHQLALEYEITDPPIIHNIKVNAGLRPRGLCYQWADDMEARLQQENFRTLSLHRAIANSNSAILIEHSTVIVSRRGDGQNQGVVVDPWRNGGVLFWSPTLADKKYVWVSRSEVFKTKHRRQLARAR